MFHCLCRISFQIFGIDRSSNIFSSTRMHFKLTFVDKYDCIPKESIQFQVIKAPFFLRNTCFLVRNGFLAAMRPNNPYLLKIRLTVDIEIFLGVTHSFWRSGAVAFGFTFERRISFLLYLSSETLGRPDRRKSFRCHDVLNLFKILPGNSTWR